MIAVDLQGHGRTADIDRPLRLELMADDIAALIRHLGLSQVDLMGYSMASLVDELQIHIANVLLGTGTRLFDISGGEVTPLERTRVIKSPLATHLRLAVHTEEKR